MFRMLYPLKFRPRLVEKMWGGRRLEGALGRSLPAGKLIGESWELYDFPPGVIEGASGWVSSEIANGPLAGRTLHSLIEEFGRAVHGDMPLLGPAGQFPILIKYLDAKENLSVQVHPDEAYTRGHPGTHLKSEAWYVVENEAGAKLWRGLKAGVTRARFAAAIEEGRVEELIKVIEAKAGQCFYLPSGTVHALGAGILVAEVQTSSDTTFRVYDFWAGGRADGAAEEAARGGGVGVH
jgi:mannose-6-phosphate isomerase